MVTPTDVWQFLYGTPYVLLVQMYASLAAAEACAWMTRDQSIGLKIALGTSLSLTVVYVVFTAYAFSKKDKLKTWCTTTVNDYWWCLAMVRVFVAIGLLRLFVYISSLLEEQNDLDGFSTGFFFLSYLHVISALKVFKLKDYLCLSDSLLAIGVMVAARLDHVHGVEELCRLQANVNGTIVPINGTRVPINGSTFALTIKSTAGFQGHVARTVLSYLSAVALFAFRISEVPYGKEAAGTSNRVTV